MSALKFIDFDALNLNLIQSYFRLYYIEQRKQI